jgi:hypothetical protein
MNENGFWNITCFCGQRLRITVTPKDYGRKKEISCTRCGTKTHTIVGDPNTTEGIPKVLSADEIKLADKQIRQIIELMAENPRVMELLRPLTEKGLCVMLEFNLMKIANEAQVPNVKQRVDPSGKIVPGTFTDKDALEFSKSFKIKL